MNEDIMEALSVDRGSESIIMVAGVGGAGGNAVRHMYEMGIEGVEFMVCNTDQQSLDKSPIDCKIKLGNDGLGAGSNPEIGRLAAIESLEAIKSRLKASNTKMLFITAGMGGGTGTGASPVIAKMAKEEGILTVAIVTSPLTLEGNERLEQALEGIDKLKTHVDSLLIINNDNILTQFQDLSLVEAFQEADDILCSAAKGIAEIITVKSDLVNVDFADVKRVMSSSGTAHMSVATAEGENRAQVVAEQSLTSPLLDKNLISGAKNILINFVTAEPNGLATSELKTVLEYIQQNASTIDENGKQHNANVIWGTSSKASLGKSLELVVVATGFDTVKQVESGKIDTAPTQETVEESVTKDQDQQEPDKKDEGRGVTTPNAAAPNIIPKPNKVANTQPKHVVLGSRKSRYANIDQLSKQPAYKTRQVQLIVTSPSNRRELLKESSTENKAASEADDSLLFK
ncbi:MAG: cell division protein FtsZ [Rikenellaceae bacterium]